MYSIVIEQGNYVVILTVADRPPKWTSGPFATALDALRDAEHRVKRHGGTLVLARQHSLTDHPPLVS